MKRIQIRLEPEQHRALVKIARQEGRSLSGLIREMLLLELEDRRRRELAHDARVLLPDYQTDPALTEFTALDSENFRDGV